MFESLKLSAWLGNKEQVDQDKRDTFESFLWEYISKEEIDFFLSNDSISDFFEKIYLWKYFPTKKEYEDILACDVVWEKRIDEKLFRILVSKRIKEVFNHRVKDNIDFSIHMLPMYYRGILSQDELRNLCKYFPEFNGLDREVQMNQDKIHNDVKGVMQM